MRKTKNNLIKTALTAEGVSFTINGMYELTGTNELVVFNTACNGEVITENRPFGRQMCVDKERSKGRFLALYSYDLMRNKTTSKIQYSHINILK